MRAAIDPAWADHRTWLFSSRRSRMETGIYPIGRAQSRPISRIYKQANALATVANYLTARRRDLCQRKSDITYWLTVARATLEWQHPVTREEQHHMAARYLVIACCLVAVL